MRTFEPPHWLEVMLATLLASPFVDRGGVHDEPVRRSYSGVLDKIEGIAWVTGASAPPSDLVASDACQAEHPYSKRGFSTVYPALN